jgi:hypothetical protein
LQGQAGLFAQIADDREVEREGVGAVFRQWDTNEEAVFVFKEKLSGIETGDPVSRWCYPCIEPGPDWGFDLGGAGG